MSYSKESLAANKKYNGLRDCFVGNSHLTDRINEFDDVGKRDGIPFHPHTQWASMGWRALDTFVTECVENDKPGAILEVCAVMETKFSNVVKNPNPGVMAVVGAIRESRADVVVDKVVSQLKGQPNITREIIEERVKDALMNDN